MASLNGVSIKGLKTFLDHDGCTCYQGNIYLEGKKIGTWSQDYMGGDDNVWLIDGLSLNKLESRIAELNQGKDLRGVCCHGGLAKDNQDRCYGVCRKPGGVAAVLWSIWLR